jgi:hypothetical protein
MSSPRAGIASRPGLARRGWLNSMMGKSLRKIGRDRHGKHHKDVCLHGKEEVQERIWFI